MYKYRYFVIVTSYTSTFVFLFLSAKLDLIPIIGKYFKEGDYRDFTWQWYKEIGGLFIMRMIIQMTVPF